MMPDFKPQEVFQDEKEEYKEPDTWTIITALDRVLDLAEDSHLSDEFWEAVKNPSADCSTCYAHRGWRIALLEENG